MSHDSLKGLHTAIIDAREGYERAAEKAETPALGSLFRQMHALHGAAHADIHAALTDKGEKADDSGSFMGNIHKAAVSVRSAITGIDDGSLSSFASGEENILDLYDKAISDETNPGVKAKLTTHRQKLAEKISEMKRIAEAA